MGVEQNKEFVRKTWEAFTSGDVKTAFDNMSDQVSWLVPGTTEISGLKRGKQAIIEFLQGVMKFFPGGLKSEIRKVYGDGDTVIMELTNRGTSAIGKPYENDYCFVFELEGGKIRRIREYADTQRGAAAMLG